MREIEFRGRDKLYDGTYGPWFYGWYTDYGIFHEIHDKHGVAHSVEPETVGQYVGIQDVNGKRLYEGDVVKMDWGTGNDTGVLYFDTTRCAFRLRNAWCGCNIQRDPTDGIQYTLIGNIFEHAKLKDEYARFYWGLTK